MEFYHSLYGFWKNPTCLHLAPLMQTEKYCLLIISYGSVYTAQAKRMALTLYLAFHANHFLLCERETTADIKGKRISYRNKACGRLFRFQLFPVFVLTYKTNIKLSVFAFITLYSTYGLRYKS